MKDHWLRQPSAERYEVSTLLEATPDVVLFAGRVLAEVLRIYEQTGRRPTSAWVAPADWPWPPEVREVAIDGVTFRPLPELVPGQIALLVHP